MLQCYIEFLPTHEVEVAEAHQDGDSEMQSVHFFNDGQEVLRRRVHSDCVSQGITFLTQASRPSEGSGQT